MERPRARHEPAARAERLREVVRHERRGLVHEPLHELAERRLLVLGRSGVDGHDPAEARGVPRVDLLDLGLRQLAAAAEALGHLPPREERVALLELLQPPGRGVEEHELERAARVGDPDLEHRLPAAHPLHAHVADRGEDDPFLPDLELGDAPHRRPVLVRARPELQGLLDRDPAALLELGAGRGVRARERRERGGEPPAPLGALGGVPGRRGLPPLGLRHGDRGRVRGRGRGRGRGRFTVSLAPAKRGRGPGRGGASGPRLESISIRAARATSRSSGGSGISDERWAAIRASARRRSRGGSASNAAASASRRASAGESGTPAARARATAPCAVAPKPVSLPARASPASAKRRGGTSAASARAAAGTAPSARSPPVPSSPGTRGGYQPGPTREIAATPSPARDGHEAGRRLLAPGGGRPARVSVSDPRGGRSARRAAAPRAGPRATRPRAGPPRPACRRSPSRSPRTRRPSPCGRRARRPAR